MNDALGDRMKFYEKMYSGDEMLMPLIPCVARLDGRAFHTFTRGLDRPFDPRLTTLMCNTTYKLMEEVDAHVAYTQSDEITLVWWVRDYKSQMTFAGRVQKLTSVLASLCSVLFNRMMPDVLPEKKDYMPVFDCRVFNVPTAEEAVNCLIWRQQDATRNSISMAAQAFYSHNELMGKNCDEMQEMLFQRGINWNKYPEYFKNGTMYLRRKVFRPFTTEELDALPPKHEARQNPDLQVERNSLETCYHILTKIQNRVGFVFDGEHPQFAEN